MYDFSKKRVVVTGAGIGIGREICRQFVHAGAQVGLNDLDPELAATTAQELGNNVTPLPGDISDVAAVRTMINSFGPIDVLVANAGITNYGSFLQYETESFQHVLDVNLRGTYFSAQAAARNMIDHNRPGSIVLMSSVCGITAHTNLSAYGMTKAGIRHLASCLAIELGEYNITVNAIGAGATVTQRTQQDDPNYEKNWNTVSANRRTAQVEDIAHTALFLASDQARHITGDIIMVDGGWTIQSPLPDQHPQV